MQGSASASLLALVLRVEENDVNTGSRLVVLCGRTRNAVMAYFVFWVPTPAELLKGWRRETWNATTL